MNDAWRPSASIEILRQRADLLQRIRAFFHARSVLEVETPIVARAGVTDPHIEGFALTAGAGSGYPVPTLFLQTSPEYAMKRLLCAGSGPIWQIARVFRRDESGALHNPEFSLLEWYRPGFELHELIDEVDGLMHDLLQTPPATRHSYRDLFLDMTQLDPLAATDTALGERCVAQGLDAATHMHRDDMLDFLFSHVLAPTLGFDAPAFVVGFPASQASLARLNPADSRIADRFELFINGVELANGFHELADAEEQRTRFEADRRVRQKTGQSAVAIDEQFIAALDSGLPDCAGVALGLDRLLMLQTGARHIHEVLAFPADRA